MGLLDGKTALVTGVANKDSIAWAATRSLLDHGARVALTYQNERLESRVRALAAECDPPLPCFQMDATIEEDVTRAFEAIGKEFGGRLDMVVHSIAFARKEDLAGGIVETSADGFKLAQEVSTYTLISLMRGALPLMQAAGGGSAVTLSYLGGERVVPNYNVMGLCKASLESAMRYLAWDLGKHNVRVNAVSAGPVKTLAARGISGFSGMLDYVAQKAPLGRNVTQEEVGNACLFLLSPLSSGITGEVLYVDAGYHIMGM
ncbi:MAG: enoyl-ACP reductase [Candidatus Sumerlaeia bacterium]|nr:enoyl-ACP reductase [Candidatus Sumerlaeia bacterium]